MKHLLLFISLHEPEFFRLFRRRKDPISIFILSDDHRYDFMGFLPRSGRFGTTQSRSDGKATEHNSSKCFPDHFPMLTQSGFYSHRVNMHIRIPSWINFSPCPGRHQVFPRDFAKKWLPKLASLASAYVVMRMNKPQAGFDYCVSFQGREYTKRSYF